MNFLAGRAQQANPLEQSLWFHCFQVRHLSSRNLRAASVPPFAKAAFSLFSHALQLDRLGRFPQVNSLSEKPSPQIDQVFLDDSLTYDSR